ncbi:MAG: CTP synthase [Candidatus Odinarchaeota archaeon]|nr:CTP synthase [Candidatus Odinarchaeota archaeon]
MVKYIFVTGGVMSGLGKGVTAASIAKLFQFRGYNVEIMKIDPYLNVDAGTMNPIEHGEVFVTEEVWKFRVGKFEFNICEIDQDFGTYERFLDKNLHPMNNITSGQVYLSVIIKERMGEYLGKTVQIIPHITNEIKKCIERVVKKKKPDILIVEVGGTVGDIESMPFLEAIRHIRLSVSSEDFILVHVTWVPYLETIRQFKTKPTQHSVKMLQSMGLQPDFIVCRTDRGTLTDDARDKISLFSNISKEYVISNPNLDVIYALPILFEEQNFGRLLEERMGLKNRRPDYSEWEEVVRRMRSARNVLKIAMPGKYTTIVDSYVSINEALKHAAAFYNCRVEIDWIDTEKIERDRKYLEKLSEYDGILITPGFGKRGVEGMIASAEYALEKDIPLLGICFGSQILFIAFCRKFLGLNGANSTEVDEETRYPVVDLLSEQREVKEKGGTMRLGAHEVYVKRGTKLYEAYKKDVILERFRHRYHIIPKYAKMAEKKGLVVSALDKSGKIINAIEYKKSWIVGVQFHPEYKSRPNKPSPIYKAFIEEMVKRKYGSKG